MARIARVVVPEYPHHVTQRGVRSVAIFSDDEDRRMYLEFMRQQAEKHRVEILVWCLMTNHVHLVAVPAAEDGLAKGIGDAHKAYTRMRNFREGVRGYLFQGRFRSCCSRRAPSFGRGPVHRAESSEGRYGESSVEVSLVERPVPCGGKADP